MKRLLEDAKRVLSTPSVSSAGNEELVSYLSLLLREVGMKVNLQQVMHSIEDASKRQFNLIGTLGDPLVERKIKKGFLLLSHLDTPNGGSPKYWTQTGGDPHRPSEHAGRLFGIGAITGKIDFLCKLTAIKHFAEKKMKMPVYLVGTCGNEMGFNGCRYLIQSGAVNPERVLIGLPTQGKLVTQNHSVRDLQVQMGFKTVERDSKGFNRRVRILSQGKINSAANADLGINAIQKIFELMDIAIENGFEVRLAQVQGGLLIGQIPNQAQADFYLTSHQFEDFKRFFREISAQEQFVDFKQEPILKIELGGLGDIGIPFLPEAVLLCLRDMFRQAKELEVLHSAHSFGLNLTRIYLNTGKLFLNFDSRLAPEGDLNQIEQEISKNIQSLGSRYANLVVQTKFEWVAPALKVSPENTAWIDQCKAALKDSGFSTEEASSRYASDAGYFLAKGYPALTFGPGGSSENPYAPNENILIEDIDRTIQFYVQLIARVCT